MTEHLRVLATMVVQETVLEAVRMELQANITRIYYASRLRIYIFYSNIPCTHKIQCLKQQKIEFHVHFASMTQVGGRTFGFYSCNLLCRGGDVREYCAIPGILVGIMSNSLFFLLADPEPGQLESIGWSPRQPDCHFFFLA